MSGQENRMEAENRVRNLMWTVSGDYPLDTALDVDSFEKSKYISLYDAVKQGAFAKYFDKDALALYVVKKCFLGADQRNLTVLAQVCVDMAVHKKAEAERAGVAQLRKKAFEDTLDTESRMLTESAVGMVKLAMIRKALEGQYQGSRRIMEALGQAEALEDASETMEIIRAVDRLYNGLLDSGFEKRQGSLEDVLSVTTEELAEYGWRDFLKDTAVEESFEQYMRRVSQAMLRTGTESEEEKPSVDAAAHVVTVSEEDLQKIYSYVELNFGRSYLSRLEGERLNYRLCRGAHADCSLYMTEGILKNPVKNNYNYQYALRQAEQNKRYYYQNYTLTKRNVSILTDVLKRALVRRSEMEYTRDDHGQVIPSLLWKVGRTGDRRLFTRLINRDSSDFAVDVLMDASGSQRACQQTAV